MKVTPLPDDPPRWTSTSHADGPEGRAAERLRMAKSLDPRSLSVTYARGPVVGWWKVRWTRRGIAWAAAWVLFGMALTAGAVTTGWWPHRRKPAAPRVPDQVLEVPAGSTLHVGRRGRWRGTLEGPAGASVDSGDADVIRLTAGTLVLSAEGGPVAVWAGARQVRLTAGASARLEMREAREPLVQWLGGPAAGGGEPPSAPATPPVAPAVKAPAPATLDADAHAHAPKPGVQPRARAVQPADDSPPTAVALSDGPAPATEPPIFTPAWPPDARRSDLPSTGATETSALEAVVTALRRQADPRAALRLLDQAETRFPRQDLQTEWATLRAEALLALGDKKAALRVLDLLPTEAPAFNRRLRVARGELRADQNRCAEALDDFQRVLSPLPHDEEDERALRGRAGCLLTGEGLPAARSDLEAYVRLFPTRPFAEQARALLQKSARPL